MAKFLDIRKAYRLTKDVLISIDLSANNKWRFGFVACADQAFVLGRPELVSADHTAFIIPAGTILKIKSFTWKQTSKKVEYILEWYNPKFNGLQYKTIGMIKDYFPRYGEVAKMELFDYELEPVND